MKKAVRFYVTFLIALTVATTGVFANPKIMTFSKGGKKVHFVKRNGKRVNTCLYCHKGTGILKKKQGLLKGQPRYRTLARKRQCGGSGCHR